MKNFLRKNKLAWWFCIIFVFLSIGLIFLGIGYQRYYVVKISQEKLQLLANEKAAQVNMFFESQKEKFKILSSMNVFKEAALYPNDPAKIAIAKNRIKEIKSILPGIGLITKEGILVVGENNPAGTDYSFMPQFPINDKTVMMFMRYYDLQRKQDYYGVFGPLYDSRETGKIIGAIGFDIELDKISVLMKETLESKTNEVYLIDETGLLLSGSEYIGQGNKKGVLIQEVKSEEAQECLADLKKYGGEGEVAEHEEGESSQYLDYMGNEVYGAHAYVPAIGGCVIAEENADEVLKFLIWDYIKNIFSNK
jgi:C4-dicarboxylate-specific signal transduction histidine kinase